MPFLDVRSAAPVVSTSGTVTQAADPSDGGMLVHVTGGSLTSGPKLATSVASVSDVTATATPTALPGLVAGPTGILVTAHPTLNTGVLRVSGNDVTASHGQPFAPSSSYVFSVANANELWCVIESGASGVLCVSAV